MAEIDNPRSQVTRIQLCGDQDCQVVEIHREPDKINQGNSKVSLKATKIPVRKTGMNSGITGGGYQCC